MTVAIRREGGIERPVTRLVQVLALAIAAATIGVGLVGSVLVLTGSLSMTVPLAPTYDGPDLGAAEGAAWVAYDAVRIVAIDPPAAARWLRWAAYAAFAAVVLVGCVVAFALCRRMRSGRPFTRFAATGLLALGLLAVVVAFAAPALQLESTFAAVSDLDLRMSTAQGFAAYEAVAGAPRLQPARFDSPGAIVTHANWLLAGVGGVIAVLSLAFRRGLALQRDTEGLV